VRLVGDLDRQLIGAGVPAEQEGTADVAFVAVEAAEHLALIGPWCATVDWPDPGPA